MLLVQEGSLSLDDSITKYLSGLPKTYNAITVRHLLNHTSGVKDYIEEFQLNRSLNYTNQELIERIGANELNFRIPLYGHRHKRKPLFLYFQFVFIVTNFQPNSNGKSYTAFRRKLIFTFHFLLNELILLGLRLTVFRSFCCWGSTGFCFCQ